jgi:hypothetical protein
MKTMLRALAVGLVVGGVAVSGVMPARAGYGNHAERATVNIQTRVALGKANLLNTVAPIQANAEQALAKTRTP